MSTISRNTYIELYGPSVGDKIRLADTELFIEVEQDFCTPGEECKSGGGRVVRDGMGQGQQTSIHAADTVITNVVILDHWGVSKADIGIKNGLIADIGSAGNPDTQSGIDIVIGPGTELIAGEGLIATPGAVAGQSHFLCPQQIEQALFSGVTTLLGGGTGPASGSKVTGATPGPWHISRMLQATDTLPVNIGLFAKGSASRPEALDEQLLAGAMGLNLHPGWGVDPVSIDTCLEVAERHDVPVLLQLDALNESGFPDSCLKTVKDRSIVFRHPGAGGETQLSALFQACAARNVLPCTSDILPPLTRNSANEQLDMLMTARQLNASVPEDLALAQFPERTEFLAAQAVLHDLGAFSILSASGQSLGRAGELVLRTWQAAHAMKLQRGPSGQNSGNDNHRAKRYLAKYTINPALAHGIAQEVGSLEPGKLADIVLWKPAFFAVKPELVLKGGLIAAAPLGDSNASVPTAEPLLQRPQFASMGHAAQAASLCFVSQAAVSAGKSLGLRKRIAPVAQTRTVTKDAMIHNNYRPFVELDSQTGLIRADGELLLCDPADELPLSQRYFLF